MAFEKPKIREMYRPYEGIRKTFDEECTLVSFEGDGFDEYGNPKREEKQTEVYCSVRSVTRAARTVAGTEGFKAELFVYVKPYEYDGQKKMILRGRSYDVGSAYLEDYESLELTVGEKLGDARG